MKGNILNILLCLGLISYAEISFSQEYMPFPQDSATWYTMYVYDWPSPPYYYYTTYKFETSGDTIINNINYTILNFGPALEDSTHYQGAYRNDTLNKKVYYIDKLDTAEMLLYDFNLLPGDTIPVIGPSGTLAFNITCLGAYKTKLANMLLQIMLQVQFP